MMRRAVFALMALAACSAGAEHAGAEHGGVAPQKDAAIVVLGLEPILECSEKECAIFMQTPDGKVRAAQPLKYAADPGSSIDLQYADEGLEWFAGTEHGSVGLHVTRAGSPEGTRVFRVDQEAGFDTVRQQHTLYQLIDGELRLLLDVGDGMALNHTSTLTLSSEGAVLEQSFDLFDGSDPKVETTRYQWKSDDGALSLVERD